MGASNSRTTSSKCIFKNWDKFHPQSLKRTLLIFFCDTEWPQYPLSHNPLTKLLSPKLSRANGTLAPILTIIEKGDAAEFLTFPFEIIPFALLNGEGAPG